MVFHSWGNNSRIHLSRFRRRWRGARTTVRYVAPYRFPHDHSHLIGYDPNDLDLDFFCEGIIRVDISRVKRSPCLNAWFSRRWKERILKEETRDEERWKSPLGIRKGIVPTNANATPGSPLTSTGVRHSTHIGRMRSKTISEAIGTTVFKKDRENGKGKVADEESSDSEFHGSDDPISSSEDEDGAGDSDEETSTLESASPSIMAVV